MAARKWSAARRKKFNATKKNKEVGTIQRMPIEAIPDEPERKKYTRKPPKSSSNGLSALDLLVQMMLSAIVQIEEARNGAK